MGAFITRALRPIKTFNIENRAHRVISREKPIPAPRYAQNIEDMKRALEIDPNLDEKLDKKDLALDGRLKDVYVTSEGKPEDDITEEIKRKKYRALPVDKSFVEDFDYGFKEPEKLPYGKTTLRNAMIFISSHQANPEEVTASKISCEYKLKEEDVETILKYYKTFEVYIPETPESKARFAGPSHFRQMAAQNKLELEEKANELENKTKIK